MYAIVTLKVRFSIEALYILSADIVFIEPVGAYLAACFPIALKRACVLLVLD